MRPPQERKEKMLTKVALTLILLAMVSLLSVKIGGQLEDNYGVAVPMIFKIVTTLIFSLSSIGIVVCTFIKIWK
jgi:hypothetical protein